MVEMRPLIGKEQLRQSKLVTQGTSAMDRDQHTDDAAVGTSSEYEFRQSKQMNKSIGRQTQFSMSPWNHKTAQQSQSVTRSKDVQKPSLQNIDMAVVGKKEVLPDPRNDRFARNLNESSLQRSQVIKPTTVNFPLNLPTQTINMSIQNSPRNDMG